MTEVFLSLVNRSIAAGWFILAVVALRFLLKRSPRWIACLLWAMVALRLVVPNLPVSPFSVVPSETTVVTTTDSRPVIHSGIPVVDNAAQSYLEQYYPTPTENSVTTPEPQTDPIAVLSFVWAMGAFGMAGYCLFSYLRISHKVAVFVSLLGNVRICDNIDTPFVLGFVKPKIYLPSYLQEKDRYYVLAHEQAHLRRRDHWWKPLGFLLLAVYWFHPLCWLAYILLCRDIEMACDQKVIRDMGYGEKAAYSEALLDCSIPRYLIAACPLAFGEVGVKQRVKAVLNYKKPAFWLVVIALLVCGIATVCFLTKPHSPEPNESDPTSIPQTSELPAATLAPEYTEVYQRIIEPYGTTYLLNGKVYQTVWNSHTYEFEKSIPEDTRSFFVAAQETLCLLLESHGYETEGMTFRVLKTYPNRAESAEKTAYFGADTLCTWQQVLVTLQVCMGDYTNFGYLYALANEIAVQYDWECDVLSSEETAFDDPVHLNLVYPSFAEKYSDAKTIQTCKLLARTLLRAAKDIWSEAEFLAARLEYTESKGIDFIPTTIAFAYNSESCPLKTLSNYVEVFWDSSFAANNEYLQGLIPVDYTEGTAGLVHTFQWLDVQLNELCQKLNYVPNERLPIQMMAILPKNLTSINRDVGWIYSYYPNPACGYATTVTGLTNIYANYIFSMVSGFPGSDYENWCQGVVAAYYTVAADYEKLLHYMDNVDPDYREIVERRIGEAYDEPSDYIKFLRVAWRERDINYLQYIKSGSELGSAFGEFFVRTYGEEAFQKSMFRPSNAAEYTGFLMDDILDQWTQDMQNPEND